MRVALACVIAFLLIAPVASANYNPNPFGGRKGLAPHVIKPNPFGGRKYIAIPRDRY